MTTQAVIDVVDALVQNNYDAREKLSNLSHEELVSITNILREAEVELMDRDLRFAHMEQAEINSGRF
ncbi:MAG: hypothetical protein CBD74_14195 [Saprospirales bacterium TMED214]|nr:MAG: hypothetical protein CBD74_14195 [Saprospirales bacterium TMED214]